MEKKFRTSPELPLYNHYYQRKNIIVGGSGGRKISQTHLNIS